MRSGGKSKELSLEGKIEIPSDEARKIVHKLTPLLEERFKDVFSWEF